MRLKILGIGLIFGVCFLQSCGLAPKKDLKIFTIKEFNQLRLGIDTKENVKNMFGFPEEREPSGWVYHLRKTPKLWLFFEGDILSSMSWSIWKRDSIKSVSVLLKEFDGAWVVIKEPMTNPHAGPNTCYLEDLKNGKRVEIHGYKKRVDALTRWMPKKGDKSIMQHLLSKVGKEFCIGSHCSKVTDPDAWKLNHCEWLEKIVVEQKAGAEQKPDN